MKKEAASCKLGEKTVCPRCSHEFVPDKELVEEQRMPGKNGGTKELDALVACPICGNKIRLTF